MNLVEVGAALERLDKVFNEETGYPLRDPYKMCLIAFLVNLFYLENQRVLVFVDELQNNESENHVLNFSSIEVLNSQEWYCSWFRVFKYECAFEGTTDAENIDHAVLGYLKSLGMF